MAENWNQTAKRLLKAEMMKRGVNSSHLVELLHSIGISETKSSVDSKISRGKFSAAFFLQCLHVMGCETIETNVSFPTKVSL